MNFLKRNAFYYRTEDTSKMSQIISSNSLLAAFLVNRGTMQIAACRSKTKVVNTEIGLNTSDGKPAERAITITNTMTCCKYINLNFHLKFFHNFILLTGI